MKNIFLKNKNMLIVLFIITVLLIGGVVLKVKTSQQKKTIEEVKKEEVLPKSEIVPTVDSSVLVELTTKDKKEVLLSIQNLPVQTKTLEYELEYKSNNRGQQGIITSPIDIQGKINFEKKITLGTCSSGSCVYDQGVSKIKVNLKFEGDYGSRLFEKEFEI